MTKITCLLLLILTSVNASVLDLDLFTAEYNLTINGIDIATEKRKLDFVNGQYIFRANAKTTGLAKFFANYQITSISKFSISNNQLNTNEYSFIRHSNGKISKNIQLKIASKTLINLGNKKTYKLNNQAHIDKLNLALALSYELNKNSSKTSYSFLVIDKDGISPYKFKNQGLTIIKLATKTVNVVKLSSFNLSKNRLIQLWLDPKQSHLMLKLQQKDSKGDYRYQIK